MRKFLKRGARFTLGAALRSIVIFSALALGAWQWEINFATVYLFTFFFCVSLVLPLFLDSKLAQPRTNLPSDYDTWLPRVRALSFIADLCLIGGAILLVLRIPYLLAVILVLSLAFSGYAIFVLLRHRANRRAFPAWLRKNLSSYAAEFVLHTPRPDGGSYQIQMWLPALETLDRDYLILVRSPRALAALRQLTDRPIIVCASWSDLDSVMTPNIRAAFYVNSVGANSDLLTYRTAQHVYLGHGDSGKPLSVHPLHRAFDFVAVAGQAAIDRYERAGLEIPSKRFITVGRPSHKPESATAETTRGEQPTIIYAPTWSGYNAVSSFSSLPNGNRLVTRLVERGYRVIFRPHPLSLQRPGEQKLCREITETLRHSAQSTGIKHLSADQISALTFLEVAQLGDALIADHSSVITDFLPTKKPIAEIEAPKSAVDPFAATEVEYVYRVQRDFSNLAQTLDLMFGADPLAPMRAVAAEYWISPDTADADHFARSLDFLFSA